MKFDRSIYLLYAVTQHPSRGIPQLEQQLEEALASGVTLLQLREKDLSEDSFLREALRIRAVTERFRVPLIINDNINVALACGADGVHIGQGDIPAAKARALIGPHRLLGVTAKTAEQAMQAERDGADYLGAGALFTSPTKKDAVPMSVDTLRAICGSVSIPVTAIGGINREMRIPLFFSRQTAPRSASHAPRPRRVAPRPG